MTTTTKLDGATVPGSIDSWPADSGQFAARWNSWPEWKRDRWVAQRALDSIELQRCRLEHEVD